MPPIDVTSRPEPRVEVQPDKDTLATAVAGELLSRLTDAQRDGRDPQVALTGGTVASRVHQALARLGADSEVDWTRVVFWWGDERFVERGSDERNATSARADLLDVLGATQVHEVAATGEAADVEAAAAAYSEAVRTHGSGRFDVVMLGVGEDAHVASLFPGHDTLTVDDRVAVAVTDSPKPPAQRVSLTFDALNRARSVWFVASGEGKADAVAAGLAADGTVAESPVRGVRGEEETVWFLDTASASRT